MPSKSRLAAAFEAGKKGKSMPKKKSTAKSDDKAKTAPTLPPTTSLISKISRANLALVLLFYILFVHFTGLYIFTRGFLLSRLSIPNQSPAYSANSLSPIAPTHSKAVFIVIDALRTDFISPHYPTPQSPNHHGVLTLPAELTAQDPARSLIFNTYSDPPTTTMQRIKGFTTGSLPTFIDAGSNFASTAVEEDSIISQLNNHGKKVVFMGDETWGQLFPTSFAHAHPFDSFNVEDLHTVDNGVIEHIFPYLAAENSTKWDFLIGHFLGVDHVGHRVGPERDTMRAKLSQMDQVLRDVVDRLDDDTLLVVLGDHGMDSKGNHGGDSDLETAAALWLYSKGPKIAGSGLSDSLADSWPSYTFPKSQTPIRHINQIDLVPTLSVMLGLPIPFNNLGSVIPECFGSSADLELATRINAEQIMRYVGEYGDADIEASLRPAWKQARSVQGDDDASTAQHRQFALAALEKLRALWAQFSVPLISLGVLILGLSVPTLLALYLGIRNNGSNWDIYIRFAFDTALVPSLGFAFAAAVATGAYFRKPAPALQAAGVVFALSSEIILIIPMLVQMTRPTRATWNVQRFIGSFILFLHAISFASNSFIMWEDRIMVFLLNTIPLIYLLQCMGAPTSTMRARIAIGSIIVLVLTRVIGLITVCREEQQPYCRVTFFSGSTATASSYALFGIIIVALQLPRVAGLVLNMSKSLAGPARGFLGITWRATLLVNAFVWILEFVESWDELNPDRIPLVGFIRLWLARLSLFSIIVILPWQWLTGSLCIEVNRDGDQTGDKSAVQVFGFANAFGSTYLLFLLITLAAMHLVSQPMAQLALSGMLCIILAHIEVVDTQRDAIIMQRAFAASIDNPGAFDGTNTAGTIVRPTFTDIVPITLLGFLGFFSTGHQAVLTTIQWKAAFVGFNTLTYPFAPLLVILNTWGPFIVSAMAIPLLALWNISPRPQNTIPLLAHSLQVTIGFILYHSAITFTSALFAAHLRRHLMVWKVFAPRFMLAGVTLLIMDISMIVAVGLGVRVTSWKVWKTFKCLTL